MAVAAIQGADQQTWSSLRFRILPKPSIYTASEQSRGLLSSLMSYNVNSKKNNKIQSVQVAFNHLCDDLSILMERFTV